MISDDDFDLLATMPPDIVLNDSRYQQGTTDAWGIITPDGVPAEPKPTPLWHLDGIGWWDARPPRRWHRHWAQTVGHMKLHEIVYRCPCGAYGEPGGPWLTMPRARRRFW